MQVPKGQMKKSEKCWHVGKGQTLRKPCRMSLSSYNTLDRREWRTITSPRAAPSKTTDEREAKSDVSIRLFGVWSRIFQFLKDIIQVKWQTILRLQGNRTVKDLYMHSGNTDLKNLDLYRCYTSVYPAKYFDRSMYKLLSTSMQSLARL